MLISGSAIWFYGNHDDMVLTEDSNPMDPGFTHQLCSDWEKTAIQASAYGVRVFLIRTGIILDEQGGALKEMSPLFKNPPWNNLASTIE